jgi:hypothetical protein
MATRKAVASKMADDHHAEMKAGNRHESVEPPFDPDKKKVNWTASPQSRAKWLAKHVLDKKKKESEKK